MAKANDGPEGHVACYYMRALVAVEQVSAEDGSKTEMRQEPVLVPFAATEFGADLELLQRYVAQLRGHVGDIRVIEKVGHSGSPGSVQKILGVPNEVAKTIVAALVGADMADISETKDGKGNVVRKLKLRPDPY